MPELILKTARFWFNGELKEFIGNRSKEGERGKKITDSCRLKDRKYYFCDVSES